MEEFFLSIGMGWTVSKMLPYLLFLILGVIVLLVLRRFVKKKLYRRLLIPVIFIPALLYFIVNPIYEGDFSNDVRVESSKGLDQFKAARLTVLAIPGCPYCKASISKLKQYSERSGNEVEFVVLSSHEEMMKDYQVESKGSQVKVRLADTSAFEKLSQLAHGSFPAFVFRKKDQLFVWNNDGFGVRALDWIESN